MPWLSRHNSYDSTNSEDASSSTQLATADSKVTFIPAQIDGLCGTSVVSRKKTMAQALVNDLRIVMQNLDCTSSMTSILRRDKFWRRYWYSWEDSRDALLQSCLSMTQIWTLVSIGPMFLFFPASIITIYAIMFWLVTLALSWPLNKRALVTIKRNAAPMTADLSDEQWFFVNGPMTRFAASCFSLYVLLTWASDRALYQHCERISHTFSRPVIGIHNTTRGPMLDFLNALFLRATHSPSNCTRSVVSQLRDACLNNSVRKVVVLGHSTGALHISLALDALYADLPVDVLSKLEIYTFGAASTHFNNPLIRLESLKSTFSPTEATQATFTRADGTIKSPVKATLASLGHRIEDHERVIPHIEHYALANDMSARCGILHSIRNVMDGRFCGRVFVVNDGPSLGSQISNGFLFREHYMDVLFPLNTTEPILDEIVSVDISTAEKREFTAMGIALPMKTIVHPDHRRESIDQMMMGSSMGSPEISPRTNGRPKRNHVVRTVSSEKRSSWGTAGTLGIDGVGKARLGAKECEGRTMRQLSRLWRYERGGQPVGEGVPVLNGFGVGMNGNGMGHTYGMM